MGIIKAISRISAKAISRSIENKEVANASSKAYKQTGADIKKAKKQGKYVNGSAKYKNYKNSNIQSARRKGSDREKFIDDLM